jgi:cation diffusion facilitator CzcD-associated flavoprotein CzcO/acetyl esterase/lipase
MSETNGGPRPDVDVAVVGAGMAGIYLLHRLDQLGLSVRAFETGDDVGGTWYWNRYPGARCDVQSVDYSYSFDPELEQEWQWSEKYATQPEILRYLGHVADKHDVRRHIQFGTKVDSAVWDEARSLWQLTTSRGEELTARHYVMATGCLSQPKDIDIDGLERFGGDTYWTSRWPHEGVDFTGKRVAVIGTGSSGIQSIPIIAHQASQLTVFQRTPNFSIPAHNGPTPADKLAAIAGRHAEYREQARWSQAGIPMNPATLSALQVSDTERQAAYERVWARGELLASGEEFMDLLVSEEANNTYAEFIRNKIRSIVDDPATAEALCPNDHPVGTKRPCLDTNYYETYNLPHVRLVNVRETPITTITETGIDTAAESMDFDAIVFATGFDAMTGAIVAVDITGRDGVTLADKWADGPKTYLGLTVAGFPNFFTITGPGSPSVLSNMVVSIEQHVEWISDAIAHLRDEGLTSMEATTGAEDAWVNYVNEAGDLTLFPKANSWYMGSNVPGKPRVFLPFVGGVGAYRLACNEVVERDYLGFELRSDGETRLNDGIIRPLKPDVTMVLEMMAQMDIPPLESMTPDEARAFSQATAAQRPPGPEVGEIVDGTFPGADGSELAYRLYRPETPGPHPVVAYFHGGGWVLGAHDSDDPFCRDLCVRTGALIVSGDYRHAPEHRFPAAADDAFAAVRWIADNAESLGGIPGQLAVCGWSAGGNVAAVACQQARDAGGPAIVGQVLVTPVTDCDISRSSYEENAEGYILTTGLMSWFWDHYADAADRTDPRASPLRGELSNLPPALVITAAFDPLRDEGAAYAAALAEAGNVARHVNYDGQIHTSLTAVDMMVTGAVAREEMAAALTQFFGASVPA